MSETLILPSGRGEKREQNLSAFATIILRYVDQAPQKMTSRGWCYFLEGFNLIRKGDFDRTQEAINECRKKGYLPIDFIEGDVKRKWSGVEHPETVSPEAYLRQWLEGAQNAAEYYTPDWWEGESYYLQMMAEKIDLVNMFTPICSRYHIPIVNAGGWYDIMERAVAAFRFKEAEQKGLTPVLLYFGDFDPFGLAISDFLNKNFWDIHRGVDWQPEHLAIDRFGLNFDFVESEHLTWIDNLESGSGRDLSQMDNRIVRAFVAQYGVRKCEANAVMRASARPATLRLCRNTIEKYLGRHALIRFALKRTRIRARLQSFKQRTGLEAAIEDALKRIDEGEREHE